MIRAEGTFETYVHVRRDAAAFSLPPIVLALTGPSHTTHTWLTPDQAREVAAALDRAASQVQP